MAWANYGANRLLRHLVGQATFTPPASVKVSLHTADPGPNGTANEAAGGSYARQTVTWAAVAEWTSGASLNGVDNSAVIEFPAMPACTVTHYCLWDPTGNCLAVQALAAQQIVLAGQVFRLPVGALDLTLPVWT